MEQRFQYETEDEMNALISNNSNLFLIRVENLLDGNFLVFSDIKPQVPERRIIDGIKEDIDYLILKQEGLI